jgi:hypothetical protein
MLEALIAEHLKALNISSQEFSELLIRLLDYGVINRDESQVEAILYDRFVQCEALVEDYLSLIHVRFQHDRKFCFVRLYPPGAAVPGLMDDEHSAFNGGFRAKPTQQEVAVILALRVEYEKALREGQVDEKGCVLLPLEGLAIALTNLLKRPLPESINERKILFKRLRQLRLIQFNLEVDFDSPECWIKIQPAIANFISEEALSQLYPPQSGHPQSEPQQTKPQLSKSQQSQPQQFTEPGKKMSNQEQLNRSEDTDVL